MTERDASPDFYDDPGGRRVFTADFLLRRGYCCRCGCRHCPYGFHQDQQEKEPSRLHDACNGISQNESP